MIKTHYANGRHTPLIVCDVCKTWIQDAAEAAAVFASPKQAGDTVDVMHVHKLGCHDAAEEMVGGRKNSSWEELEVHLLNLTHNTGLSVERMQKVAARRDEFGL